MYDSPTPHTISTLLAVQCPLDYCLAPPGWRCSLFYITINDQSDPPIHKERLHHSTLSLTSTPAFYHPKPGNTHLSPIIATVDPTTGLLLTDTNQLLPRHPYNFHGFSQAPQPYIRHTTAMHSHFREYPSRTKDIPSYKQSYDF